MFFQHRRVRRLLIVCAGTGLAVGLVVAADTAADLFLGKVRAGIASDVSDLRGVTCMESIERTRYAPRTANRNATCGELIAAAANTPMGNPEWRSRLRLDVTSGPAAEEFALTERRRFEVPDIGGVLSAAAAGSGEFSMFLRGLAAAEAGAFQSLGVRQSSLGRLPEFGFTPTGANPARGSLFVMPGSGELKRIALTVGNSGNSCRIQYTTDYTTTRVGDREIVVPHSSLAETILQDGTELRSETYFSGCRRPGAAANALAASTPPPVPPHLRLRIRLQSAIDTATAATGDPVTAVIRTTIKDKQAGNIVHAGDRLHGRIALIEEYLTPRPHWNITIVFETIERGVGERGIDQGIEQPVSIVPLDNAVSPEEEKVRPANAAYYVVQGANAVLDPKVESEWETR